MQRGVCCCCCCCCCFCLIRHGAGTAAGLVLATAGAMIPTGEMREKDVAGKNAEASKFSSTQGDTNHDSIFGLENSNLPRGNRSNTFSAFLS